MHNYSLGLNKKYRGEKFHIDASPSSKISSLWDLDNFPSFETIQENPKEKINRFNYINILNFCWK